MINDITCSMLQYPSTSDYYEIKNSFYKSKVLELTIKNLMKQKKPFIQSSTQFVKERTEYKIRNRPNGIINLKAMIGCSMYNTIAKLLREKMLNG